jgi:rare lipoprotein A
VKFRFSIQRAILLLAVATSLGACTSAGRWEEPETPPATVVKPDTSAGKSPAAAGELPRSKYGNPPFYEVYGVRYTILPGSSGYREEGVASWYGRKFHGRRTSSGEPYDMYKMSAAHTTLPLPTNARVTNLQNGKSVIVRINDRGPFAKDRLIDLSYAAAVELDMITNGTARVEVVALDGSATSQAQPAQSQDNRAASAQEKQKQTLMYLQVGAFGARGNAEQLESRLNASGISNTRVHLTPGESPAMYRVRIGPMFTIEEYDKMVQRVSLMQITDTQLVIETVGAKHPSRDAAFASR